MLISAVQEALAKSESGRMDRVRIWNSPMLKLALCAFDRLYAGTASLLKGRRRLAGDLAALALVLAGLAAAMHTGRSFAASAAEAVTPYPHDLAQVSFAVAGDVIPHEAVRNAATAAGKDETGWTALLTNVSDVFQGADFGFVNLETPVAPEHSKGTKAFLFDAPPALPTALKASGIKMVLFANNHAMDQGWAGFAETRKHLTEIGLVDVGTSDDAATAFQPVFVEANGIKVGWLGITRWLNGGRNPDKIDQPHVNFFPYPHDSGGASGADEAALLAAVKAAREKCDLLVVAIHWGVEYATAPRAEDVDIAHKMMEAGASVIVGGHPHVLQQVETYRTTDGRDTLIYYSLGNFLSNQSRTYVEGLMPDTNGDPRDSMIGLFSAVKKDYGPGGIRVEVGHAGILPVWGENNRNEIAAGRTKIPVIEPVLIDRELPALQARMDALNKAAEAPEGLNADEKKEFVDLTKRIKLLTDRRAQILARTGDEYVTAPPKVRAKP